ncbi:MAG: insulinase family protein [Thermomicrobiales bacterium]|nr:insulinase family protein [Thermomicrobiales bacterium]
MITTAPGVLRERLGNGLEVFLVEDHSAPIATFWTWYRVGSRNELPGLTGVSHWVEHMQFKGTERIAKGQIFGDVSRVGGTLNALTSQDWTAYHETLPISQLELALSIESDRMSNSLFDAEEVASERTVILSERQGSENRPGFALYEEVAGTAFHAHPYRHMVIGHESDLRAMGRDDLYRHYRRFYHPGNAFIVAVGDFSASELFGRIERAFGQIPAGETVPRAIGVIEPPQPGERRAEIRKPSGSPLFRMAFHTPAATSPDFVPLLVAEAVLSGGGGAMGRSSRLYRALVASGLARGAGSDMSVTIDPYLFQVAATGLPGSDLGQIEQVVRREIGRLQDEATPHDELARAKRQLLAQLTYAAEGVTNQAYWLGQWEIVDSLARAHSLPDEIRGVTPEEVQRVAQEYLRPERSTVGWLVPTEAGGPGETGVGPVAVAPFGPVAWGIGGGEPNAYGFERHELSNGLAILSQDRPHSQSVAVRFRVPAGSIYEADAEAGLAHLTARAMGHGSGGLTFEEINARTDDLGSSLSVDAGKQFLEARIRCLREDLPEMVGLMANAIRRPDFPADQVDLVRAEQLGAIQETDNDTRAVADRELRRQLYPAPNPLGRASLGDRDSVANLSAPAAHGFHRQFVRPERAVVAVVGGIGSGDEVAALIDAAFGDWASTANAASLPDLSVTNGAAAHVETEIPGKSQADLAAGLATVSRLHPDFVPLDVANLILGRLGLMGRLGAEVRDKQGLAYYVYSQVEPRRDGTLWSARAGVDPANVDRALGAIRAELERLRAERVSEQELADAKSYLVGVLPLALESHDGVAATLLSLEEYGLGLDFLDRYPDLIAAVTDDEILRVAAEHLDPARLVVAVARPG